MSDIDKVIFELFSTRWRGDLSAAPISEMRAQLRKNIQNQIDGYWSGSTAYRIMVDGGFIVDSKRKIIFGSGGMAEGKKLTIFGKIFMDSFDDKGKA